MPTLSIIIIATIIITTIIIIIIMILNRTTLWCLGCLVHEMLSGQPPFIADDQPTLFLLIGEFWLLLVQAKKIFTRIRRTVLGLIFEQKDKEVAFLW